MSETKTTSQPSQVDAETTTTTTKANDNNATKKKKDVVTPFTLHSQKDPASLAPFNPTCEQAIQTTLQLLNLNSQDILFDLGCGDAKLLLAAAQQIPNLRCVGIELDPIFVQRGKEELSKLPVDVQKRVDIRQGDLLQLLNHEKENGEQKESTQPITTPSSDGDNIEGERIPAASQIMGIDCQHLSLLKDCTAMYLFLLPKGLKRIQPLLQTIGEKKSQQKNFRVVAYMFQVHQWKPILVDTSTKGDAKLYLYQFPDSVINKKDETNADKEMTV